MSKICKAMRFSMSKIFFYGVVVAYKGLFVFGNSTFNYFFQKRMESNIFPPKNDHYRPNRLIWTVAISIGWEVGR